MKPMPWVVLIWCALAPALAAQTPQWMAASNALGTNYFRKTFRIPPLTWNSRLTLAADDSAEVFLNGVLIGRCLGPQQPMRTEVTVRLNHADNVLAVRSVNASGPGGVLAQLNLGGQTNVVSDGTWLVNATEEPGWNTLGFNAAHWQNVRVLGANGAAPWGDVLSIASATPAEALSVPPGFRVQLLRSALANEGSWACLAFDERGRLVISPEGNDRPLLRLTLTNGEVARVEPFASSLRFAMGLLYAHGSLYANARGPQGAGLYRLRDTNSNDQFQPEEVELLKAFSGGSEHGYHALALGPDARIYVLNGNSTKVPPGISERSPLRHYREDVLSLNPNEGEKSPQPAPAGYILRTDADGREWELWMGGLRNAYDFDFNADGELFAFDSDMEWDWGTPWYRPTRIVHCVSGADFGWREGTRLWPDDYEDSLPGAVDVGLGSPTGVKFGGRSRFPAKYREALFALDWSYGRIFAVHLTPHGSTYRGRAEVFLRGTPLNLTDVEFGPDGAMYFITGGRGTQSGLYRVSYVAGASDSVAVASGSDGEQPRRLRRQLESLHGITDSSAASFAWPHLGSEDRFVRHAARVALESQDVSVWQQRALQETNITTALPALLALARVGSNATPALLDALARWPLANLPAERALTKARVLQLTFLRQGFPEGERRERLVREIEASYPAAAWPLNRELSRLAIVLGTPGAISKTLALIERAPNQEQQFHFVAQLRNVRSGWKLADRERFFTWWLKRGEPRPASAEMAGWFADVGRSYVDGAWVDKYLREFRAEALATLTPEEKKTLAPLLAKPFEKARTVAARERSFVREWTMADLVPHLERVRTGRNHERGRQAFADAQCLACHRFGNDGGVTGPELTSAASKYDTRALLESIVEPSKVINEQYAAVTVELKDGDTLTGRLLRNSEESVEVETDPVNGTREVVPKGKVASVSPSKQSAMPAGLLNVLTLEEILHLLAYIQASR